MRITSRQLRQIIKEEVSRMMSEEDATVATDSLKAASNFEVNYEFKSDGYADNFLKEVGLRDVKSGKLEFSIFKNSAGEIRALTRYFVSDTGKRLAFSMGYAGLNILTPARVNRVGVPAPEGATVGMKIEIPVSVSATQMGKNVTFKFTAV